MADGTTGRYQTQFAPRCARARRDRAPTLCRAGGVFKKQTRPPQLAGSAGGLAIVPGAIPLPPPLPPPPIAQAIVLETASAAANPIAMSLIAISSDRFRAMKNGLAWLYVPDPEHSYRHPSGRCGPRPKFRNDFKCAFWEWWGKKDSNLRSHKTADLQSAPFATRDTPPSQNPIATYPPKRRQKGHG